MSSVCRTWKYVPSPYVLVGSFTDVAGTGSRDVWAVGSGNLYPIIEHWDGSAWTLVDLAENDGGLAGVAAVSPADAWAVGINNAGTKTLIEHWDGATWSRVPSPSPGADVALISVDAVSTDDVWAAGEHSVPGIGLQPLYEHWDGAKWVVVKEAPGTEQTGGFVFGIDAYSANDVWAVGNRQTGPLNFDPLAEHWDGRSWTLVEMAPMSPGFNEAYDVYAAGPDDVWAVGIAGPGGSGGFIQHWDGSSWTLLQDAAGGQLFGIAGSAPNSIWAVGNHAAEPLTMYWDGRSWSSYVAPNPGGETHLTHVDPISSGDVWAVGNHSIPSQGSTTPAAIHSTGVCP